jgi:hypothetical protein
MSESGNKPPEGQARVERKLEELAREHPDPHDLAANVSSTSESLAELFGNAAKPASEQAGDVRPDSATTGQK